MDDANAIKEMKDIFNSVNAKLDRNNDLLSSLILRNKELDKKEEKFLFKEVVVQANDEKASDAVNNPGFTRARVFLDAGFTSAHTGGLTVSLIYKNSKMSDVMSLISSNGSCGKASEPVDVANLSGFYFIIKNHDSSNDTAVKNFRVVLYNEMRS